MKKNKKLLAEEKEQEECIGTCFACVPQCERHIPEKMDNVQKSRKKDKAEK